ncbi:MAG: septum formation initiator family protein [Tannerella sp.]|jgi:cell division protein FtsB|nr:septum formation initiator family protein [Tannerella sp.]
MTKIKDFYNKYLAGRNKYWVFGIAFVVFTFLIGDMNLINRYRYDKKIKALEKEIELCRQEIERSRKKLKELRTDREGLERFAREEYFMKKQDEDIFIIEE